MDYHCQPSLPSYEEATPAYDAALPPAYSSNDDLMALESNYSAGYDTPAYPGTPMKGSSLDMTKFKTKLCRHYQMGRPCPFESRCAFAHGLEEQAAARAAAQAAVPPPPAYDEAFATPSAPGSEADSSEARTNSVQPHAAEEDRSCTPPAYPTKYRYDPYNIHSGVVYAH